MAAIRFSSIVPAAIGRQFLVRQEGKLRGGRQSGLVGHGTTLPPSKAKRCKW